jgi:hypothetical protein
MIELANTKTTKAAQVRAYVAKNPKAKPAEIAKAVDTGLQYVYTVMWNTKKKATDAKKALAKKAIKGEWKTKRLMQAADGSRDIHPFLDKPMQIEMFEPKADPVNHPAHYKVGGIETIDFIEAKKLNYNIGNVVKYLTRADHKGNRKQDLEKAMWYLNREISALK